MSKFLHQTSKRFLTVIRQNNNREQWFIEHINQLLQFEKIGLFVSIFLLRLPPVYTLPTQNALFNSHSLARYILLLLLGSIIIRSVYSKIQLKLDTPLFTLFLLYFFSQSISVVAAVNISSFLLLYKHIVFSMLLFIVTIYIVNSRQDIFSIIIILIGTAFLNFIYEYLLYFQPSWHSLLSHLIYDKEWDVIQVNLMRNRYFITIYDSALIPLFVYLTLKTKLNIAKLIFVCSVSIVVFFTYLSNFRTLFVMSFFGIIAAIFIFFQKKKQFILSSILIIVGFFIGIVFLSPPGELNTLNRIVDPQSNDYTSLTTRWDWWQQSVEMAESSPVIGVGLRNYYDNLQKGPISNSSLFSWQNKLQTITYAHPHSVFFGTLAETGLFGLISLITLLSYFALKDLRSFTKKHLLSQVLIASFWILFSYSVLNPPDTLPYLSLFWLFRALIFKSYL